MKKISFLVLAFVLFASTSFTQSAELVGVSKREFRGVFPIMNKTSNLPEGYYCFYINEKETAGMVNFIVAIFDVNMKMVKQTPISITKRSVVDGSEFNGKDFMFVFNDFWKKTITYVTMDKSGNIIKTEGIKEEKRYVATADVYSSGEEGFIIVKPILTPKIGYSVEKVNRELVTLWSHEVSVDKGYTYAEAVEVQNEKVLIVQVTGPTRISNKMRGEIISLDASTGKKQFGYSLYDGTYTRMPSTILVDREHNIVTSGMYFEGEKWDHTNSDGIFFLKISGEGKQMLSQIEDWGNGIQKVLKNATAKRATISSKPKVFFHTLVQSADGGYQVIGETFRTSYQMVSSALADAITGRFIGDMNSNNNNSKPITFEVLDFAIFNYDIAGKMTNLNMIEKPHTKISCYPPFNGMGGLSLSKWIARYGFFNYGFTTRVPGSDQEYLVSSNFEKDKYIGFSTIDPGQESVTKTIPIAKKDIKGGGMGVMPHLPGKIAVYVFDKKAETVSLYTEAIKL